MWFHEWLETQCTDERVEFENNESETAFYTDVQKQFSEMVVAKCVYPEENSDYPHMDIFDLFGEICVDIHNGKYRGVTLVKEASSDTEHVEDETHSVGDPA